MMNKVKKRRTNREWHESENLRDSRYMNQEEMKWNKLGEDSESLQGSTYTHTVDKLTDSVPYGNTHLWELSVVSSHNPYHITVGYKAGVSGQRKSYI